jgi:hypothetical protein
MNNRLKQLAREAGLLVHPTGVPTRLEKFAELIVQECCNQLREIDAMAIRKHFGVEE